MKKTTSIAAYVAWALALAAILIPPALADAGLEAAASVQESIFALLGDDPEPPLVLAGHFAESRGWHV